MLWFRQQRCASRIATENAFIFLKFQLNRSGISNDFPTIIPGCCSCSALLRQAFFSSSEKHDVTQSAPQLLSPTSFSALVLTRPSKLSPATFSSTSRADRASASPSALLPGDEPPPSSPPSWLDAADYHKTPEKQTQQDGISCSICCLPL